MKTVYNSSYLRVPKMLLPHNPYREPQHYKRHVCRPSCSCENIDFCGYLRKKKSGQQLRVGSLYRSVLIFQPTVDSSASDTQSELAHK
jgi:hypothetical protein